MLWHAMAPVGEHILAPLAPRPRRRPVRPRPLPAAPRLLEPKPHPEALLEHLRENPVLIHRSHRGKVPPQVGAGELRLVPGELVAHDVIRAPLPAVAGLGRRHPVDGGRAVHLEILREGLLRLPARRTLLRGSPPGVVDQSGRARGIRGRQQALCGLPRGRHRRPGPGRRSPHRHLHGHTPGSAAHLYPHRRPAHKVGALGCGIDPDRLWRRLRSHDLAPLPLRAPASRRQRFRRHGPLRHLHCLPVRVHLGPQLLDDLGIPHVHSDLESPGAHHGQYRYRHNHILHPAAS
mmetsp:Transcript_10356/g.33447  ORF Transcript_10356/g.33447 Transcript_10356/m.33447 type:complete len:291 (+) Transcript_10356:333-1205(+)